MSAAPENRFNDGCEYREQLGAVADSLTLLDYLSQRYAHSSSEEWTARIESGQVLLDKHTAQVDSILRQGSELVWQRPAWIEPDAPRSFDVLYEDADILVVNKPAGLPTLPGANFLQATLLYQVQRYAPDAAPVHRLGRWTSGIVLCARNTHAGSELLRQWSLQSTLKRYRTLISGVPEWNSKTIDTSIGPVPHALLGSVHAASITGKAALSKVSVLERRDMTSLCDVRISTGRPHQIRIHLAAAGYPLFGDPLYISGGVPAADSHALPGDPGYLLHAAELRFQHPRTGEQLALDCMPPVLLNLAEGTAV